MKSKTINDNSLQPTRRDFLKTSATIAGAAGLLSVTGAPHILAGAEKPSKSTEKRAIKLAGYKFDRVEGLVNGRVPIEGYESEFEIDAIGDLNTNIFSGPQSHDVTEIGLHPFMLVYANEGFRDYSLLPIFPLRTFRHKSIFIRTDRGINKPEDLRGKKIATPGFSSTSLTWIRGILQHEYGVKPKDIEWFVSTKDSSADAAGKVSKQESMIPEGLSVSKGPAGKDESDLLEDGDVDALLHAAEPRGYVQGNPIIARLFSDPRTTEREYFAKTGIFPIMHAVAIRNSLMKSNPDLPKAVFKAYSEAKKLMYNQLQKMGWAMISLPWVGQELEETQQLMGKNFWPYGIEPNRETLEALFQYSHEQGLASRLLKIEDIFEPTTLEISEP